MACGTGVHISFLKKHFKVEGFDASPEMLNIARKRNRGIQFHHGDMRTFKLGKSFDVITCLFSAIGYMTTFSDLKAAIRNMVHHLNPGGVLLVEPWITLDRFQRGRIDAIFLNQPGLKIARMNRTEVKGRISMIDFHYLIGTPSRILYFTEPHRLGLFTQREYQMAFKSAGLRVEFDSKGLMGRGLYIGTWQPQAGNTPRRQLKKT